VNDATTEAGRLLFAKECVFIAGATDIGQVPDGALPEVAFAGRSNVGKSSLVNALTGRKTLARVSNTPGRTQQLNFFTLGDRLCLVDLPGYGYHQAGKTAAARWSKLTEQYLAGRPELRRVLLLIDSRHGVKPLDEDIMKVLDQAAVVYQVVLTKVDKSSTAELAETRRQVGAALRKHVAAHPEILDTSSEAGTGIAELRAELALLAA
jgi:GTP-binding protein